MKNSIKYLSIVLLVAMSSCSDYIDLNSESNIIADNYYTNYTELQAGLTGCYKGMQNPLTEEWSLTELRSDNTVMDGGTSTSTPNHDLAFLDQFYPPTTHQGLYKYWLNTYNNIKNTNTVLNAAGANYNPTTGIIQIHSIEQGVIRFYNMIGELLGEQETNGFLETDLRNLDEKIIFVQFTSRNSSSSQRVILLD